METHYTPQQTAAFLACDDETILAHIHSGELVAVNICKKRDGKRPTWRIPESSIGRFLISRRNAAATQPSKATTPKRPATKRYV